jgi:hypothetical protein
MNLGALFTSIGESGAQAAEAKMKADQFKLEQLFQKLGLQQAQQNLQSGQLGMQERQLGLQQGGVNLQEAQQRLKQMGLPKSVGLTQGPMGETYGVTYSPEKGFKTDQIIAGQNLQQWSEKLHKMIEYLPPDRKAFATTLADYFSMTGEPDKAVTMIKDLAVRREGAAGSPEEQYLQALVNENNGKPLTAEQLKKAHEQFQPYGQQKLIIMQSGLNERKQQDLLSDLTKLETLTKPLAQIQRVGELVPEYVSKPSGPGDAALLLAFVEATKPSQGFRFTETERKMFIGLRGLIEGAQARVEGGFSGILFGDDQRKLMAGIVTKAAQQAAEKQRKLEQKFTAAKPELKELGVGNEQAAPGAPPAGAVVIPLSDFLKEQTP